MSLKGDFKMVKKGTSKIRVFWRSINLKNYLIITPDQLAAGLIDFVTWKKSQGYNVVVEKLSSPNATTRDE